jgi:hypothetical protein
MLDAYIIDRIRKERERREREERSRTQLPLHAPEMPTPPPSERREREITEEVDYRI